MVRKGSKIWRTIQNIGLTKGHTQQDIILCVYIERCHLSSAYSQDDSADTLLNKELPTTETLVDHLLDVTMITYINTDVENKHLHRDYKSLYKISHSDIVTDISKDDRPFTMDTGSVSTTTRPPRRHVTVKGTTVGPPIVRPCVHCNTIGHTQSNCPVSTTPGSIGVISPLYLITKIVGGSS